MNLVGELGQDAGRALRTEEDMAQILSGGGTRDGTGSHDLAVGQDGFKRDEHVLDVPVLGGELTCGSRGNPTTDRRESDRLRKVPHRIASLV